MNAQFLNSGLARRRGIMAGLLLVGLLLASGGAASAATYIVDATTYKELSGTLVLQENSTAGAYVRICTDATFSGSFALAVTTNTGDNRVSVGVGGGVPSSTASTANSSKQNITNAAGTKINNATCSTDQFTISTTNNGVNDTNDNFTITATVVGVTKTLSGEAVDDEWAAAEWDFDISDEIGWGMSAPVAATITIIRPGNNTTAGAPAPGEFNVENYYDSASCGTGNFAGAEVAKPFFDSCSGPATKTFATAVLGDGMTTSIPFYICPPSSGVFPADKKGYKSCICVTNTKSPSETKRCKPTPTFNPDANLYFPSFVMTASYDWLHNFYDRNTAKSGADTDSDTDNFNRVIMVDANLFPIHTAIRGDQEFPNIVMRNWTAVGGGGSPSVNDYVNRSVAAVANYIPWESFVPMDSFYKNNPKGMTAVGMRTHLEWVYVTDPANNNFRRYKFVKLADDLMPPLINNGLDGDIAAIPAGAQSNIGDCTNCNPCNWYYGESEDAMCSGTGNESDCCPLKSPCASGVSGCKSYSQSCNDKEQLWAFFPKRPAGYCTNPTLTTTPDCAGADKNVKEKCQGGGSTAKMPSCSSFNLNPIYKSFPYPSGSTALGAPYMTWPLYVSGKDMRSTTTGKVRVRLELTGFSHDETSGLAVIVDSTNTACTAVAVGGGTDKTLDHNQILTSSGKTGFVGSLSAFGNPKSGDADQYCSATDGCLTKAYQEFEVPVECIKKDYTSETVGGYVPVKIYPCGGTGLVLKVPMPPKPQDQAFQVQLPASATAQQIRERWVNVGNYMNTMPPRSYPGYANYTVGYGSRSNHNFFNASSVRFKDPRDIDAFRDYFDVKNEGPTYIFVADTGNSRIQVFMNATGSAGDVGAPFPIRPVRVKGPNAAKADTNELGFRAFLNMTGGNGRRGDFRSYTTLSGATFQPYTTGRGQFYFPHGVAVDQDPDSRDVYLFVADTYNHRIQVFRDLSGVSSQPIGNKNFDFRLEEMWGTYPYQDSISAMSQPGPYSFRYPKGIDIARFKNNSAFLYVVDSKNYRLMRYLIGESPASLDANGKVTNSGTGILTVRADAGIGYNATDGFSRKLLTKMGTPFMQSNANPGFLNPQDVSTGYSGFFIYSGAINGTQFLNNYMVYVTDSARNNTTINPRLVSTRVMQLIDVPNQAKGFSTITGLWVPWETTRDAKFSTRTAAVWNAKLAAADQWKYNLKLGQTPFGLKGSNALRLYSGGVYDSTTNYTGANTVGAGTAIAGMSNNAGRVGYFTDRPAGIDVVQWNTLKPIDIRVVNNDSSVTDDNAEAYMAGERIPQTKPLRFGVSSRYLSFGTPLNKRKGFKSASTKYVASNGTGGPHRIAGSWDALFAGKLHIFCYNEGGKFTNYTALYPQLGYRRFPPYNETYRPSYVLPGGLMDVPGKYGASKGCPSKGVVKIVAEDKDFSVSGRTGTVFYRVQ